jgi:glycosyltransferase involved in cell wall biosynthesis
MTTQSVGMRAKVIHDNINAGGGSERLAMITIDLLIRMGFKVDLASFNKPDIDQLRRDFGDIVSLDSINPISLDRFSTIGLQDAARHRPNTSETDGVPQDAYVNDNDYSLIINTHGDLLPYYDTKAQADSKNRIITYCHFPIIPQVIMEGDEPDHARLAKRLTNVDDMDADFKKKVLENAAKTYDLMMKRTTVVTNSHFSKRAIEERYGSAVEPTVVYPPVDVEKFRSIALHSGEREYTILVVSRFSPDKKLENAIEICSILANDMKMDAKMVLVGNIAVGDEQYLEELRQLVRKYGLDGNIQIEVDASFDRLLELMRKSKVYLHPLSGEPFGISIVEAMSAGLIPVVPDDGGYTEFVPEYYQFHTHKQAADIIGKILIASDNSMQAERSQLSEYVSKFSNEKYEEGLRKVIESLLPPDALAA